MRVWFSGPRILDGLVRPGISLGREDFRRMSRNPAAISPAGTLGIFKRDTDGAIFLGIPDQNGENERLANVKPVAAFAFSSADAAITAREGAIIRLGKHLNTDGLLVGLSVGQAVSSIKAEAAALGLPAQFVRVTVAPPEQPKDWAETPLARAFGATMFLIAVALIIAAVLHGQRAFDALIAWPGNSNIYKILIYLVNFWKR
jgi:hypothetical protein